jgi:hypothetical protein
MAEVMCIVAALEQAWLIDNGDHRIGLCNDALTRIIAMETPLTRHTNINDKIFGLIKVSTLTNNISSSSISNKALF